jgi:hypothetical protein
MGRNLDLSKWKDAPNARKYRQIIQKAERLVKVHNNDAAYDIEAAEKKKKKALVMNWDNAILERLKNKLADMIDILNEEDKG